jgi:hypothetical protein
MAQKSKSGGGLSGAIKKGISKGKGIAKGISGKNKCSA